MWFEILPNININTFIKLTGEMWLTDYAQVVVDSFFFCSQVCKNVLISNRRDAESLPPGNESKKPFFL